MPSRPILIDTGLPPHNTEVNRASAPALNPMASLRMVKSIDSRRFYIVKVGKVFLEVGDQFVVDCVPVGADVH